MSDFDLIIIGAGPAGLAAAQYGARANLKVLVVEQFAAGGQAAVIDVLENYPGNVSRLDAAGGVVFGPKSGFELTEDMRRQAEEFGASFLYNSVVSIRKEDNIFIVNMADEAALTARAVIIASGAKPRLLNVPGEKEFSGKGVSYCATCDGNFFKNKKIIVVGGGDAACDEARYLSRLSDKITMVHRRDTLRAQKALAQRTIDNPNINLRFNTIVKEIKGDAKVKSIIMEDVKTGRTYEEETDAVFIFAGIVPQSNLAAALGANLDNEGYIITDMKMAANIADFSPREI